MQDLHAGVGELQMAFGQAEAARVFGQVGQQARLLAFQLQAQAHDGIGIAHGLVEVAVHVHGPGFHTGGQQGARRAQAHPGAQHGEQVHVGAGHAAVGDIAQDEHLLAGKGIAPDLPQGEAVQQGLGGMGMPAVTAVDDAAGDALRQELGRTAAGMPDDDDVRPHGLQGQGRVLEALALVEAGTGLGQGVGVG